MSLIAVPLAAVLELLQPSARKSNDQIEVEAELRRMIELRKLTTFTEDALQALFEEAGQEVALRKIAAKMQETAHMQIPLANPLRYH